MNSHKTLLFIIILFNLSMFTQELTFEIGCCTYESDPFRGFSMKECKETSLETFMFEKDTLGYEMIEICEKKFSGIPANDNIIRLKKDIYKFDRDQCLNDCKELIQQLNENYYLKHENNRMNEAKKLKEKKKKIEDELRIKRNKITKSLNEGKSCTSTFKYNKNSQHASLYNPCSLINRGNNKIIKESVKQFNNYEKQQQKIENKINELMLNTDNSLETDEEKNFRSLSLENKIEILDLEIMYFEKKNHSPLSYILDRFNIKDEILVKLIKNFEISLEGVINDYKRYMKENIFFSLKLLNNAEIKFNKKV